MPSVAKKLIFSFFASLIVLFSLAPSLEVLAQKGGGASGQGAGPTGTTNTPAVLGADTSVAPWYNQGFGDWYNKVYNENISPGNEIFGERYTAAQVQWVFYGVWSFIINYIMGPKAGAIAACVFSAPSQQQELGTCLGPALTNLFSYAPQHSSQSLASLVFADRPISAVSMLRSKVENFTIVPVAHAQTVGFGFSALQTVQTMWVAFRNVAYGLFVIAAVVFAFMIMFRVKIDPKTVITVQSAIPKIIIALILVTFSYAIAGLLIDLMYVVIGLLSVVLAPMIPHNAIFQPTASFNASDVFNMLTVGPITKSATGAASASGIFGLIGLYLTPLIVILFIAALIAGAASLVFTGSVVGAAGGVIAAIAFIALVVVMIILIWMALKTIWALFKAFANIILLTVFAPIQLSLGVLVPNFGFGQWVKSYVSHLAVFVATGFLAIFSWIFSLMAWNYLAPGSTAANLTLSLGSGSATANPWPPLIGTFVGSGDFGIAVVLAGAAFVFFTMIPKTAELIQSFLAGKPFAYGTSISELTGPAGSLYGNQAAMQVASGNAPAPFNRIPFVQNYVSGLNGEQQKILSEQIQNLFRPPR